MNEFERLVKLIGTAYDPEQWVAGFPWIHITLAHAVNGHAHIASEVSGYKAPFCNIWYIIEIDLSYQMSSSWRLDKVSIERMEAS